MLASKKTPTGLSERQAVLLRDLVHQTNKVCVSDVDGRVLRALVRQGFVELGDETVAVTSAGAEHYHTQLRRRRRVGVRIRGPKQTPRQSILEAVESLKLALPRRFGLKVGDLHVTAEELIAGLEQYASGLAAE